MTKKTFARLLALLYIGAALLWLGLGLTGWLSCRALEKDGTLTTRELSVQQAEKVSLFDDRTWGSFREGSLLTTNTDAQLIWKIGAPVSGLTVTLRSSQPIKDLELYYTTAEGQDFSVKNRLTPVWSDPLAGSYRFELPDVPFVEQLRLDPTSAGGAFLEINDITLNEPLSPDTWFVPDAAQLLALLAGPALLAWAVRVLVLFWKHPSKGDPECNISM